MNVEAQIINVIKYNKDGKDKMLIQYLNRQKPVTVTDKFKGIPILQAYITGSEHFADFTEDYLYKPVDLIFEESPSYNPQRRFFKLIQVNSKNGSIKL